MIDLWAQADAKVTRQEISGWLKKDDDPDYVNCSDKNLAIFLNGMINKLRGKKDGPAQPPESRLNNNIILRKLKIALNFRDEDICRMMSLGGFDIGKSELSAFFRKVGHRHYRELQDQMLRKFLQGLQSNFRTHAPADTSTAGTSSDKKHSEPAIKTRESTGQPINSDIWQQAKK
jgi:uncharacterized protein YehS (DUF1456 family)